MMIDTIMLFAAGRGTRMKHLTDDSPKTLINILGRPILHYTLDMCKQHGFKRIIINTHYLGEKIDASLKEYRAKNSDCPEIIVVHQEELLENGGAIKNAYKILGDKSIFALNTDVILRANYDIFQGMEKAWNPKIMDFLLLMQPYDKSIGYTGHGDFEVNDDGTIDRPNLIDSKKESYSFMYAGLVILKPNIVAANPLKIFSLKDYYLKLDRVCAIKAKNIKWYHVSRPEDIADIERDLGIDV